jgi:Zn finger protein HypA/HybF involved in hydrogenase expression
MDFGALNCEAIRRAAPRLVLERQTVFEDETIDIACPKCGHNNPALVREFEGSAEIHLVCEKCKAGLRIEAGEFKHRLEQVAREAEELEREAKRGKARRSRKDDFQI